MGPAFPARSSSYDSLAVTPRRTLALGRGDLFLPFFSVGKAGFGVTYAENEHVFPVVCRQGHRYKSSEHLVA